MTTPEPGWYDDPQDPNAQRYWDGQDWTPHRHRKPTSPQTQASVTPAPPPAPAHPPVTTKGLAGQSKVALVAAGLALVLVIAVVVAGRVLIETFVPGLLLVAVIAIVVVTLAVRSGQPVPRKAVIVTATVVVVAVAIPASLIVVYPVYHRFFGDRTNHMSASPNSPNGPASDPAGSPNADAGRIKVTLNGADPSHGDLARGGVKCVIDAGIVKIAATGVTTNDSYRAEMTDTDPPQVKSVMLGYSGQFTSWGYQQSNGVGDATASKQDRTYKITGHATMQGNTSSQTEPFEFEATCPPPATYTAGRAGNYSMTLNGKNVAQGNDAKCSTSSDSIGIHYIGVDSNHAGDFGVTNLSSNPQLSRVTVNQYDPTAETPDGGRGWTLEWDYESIHTQRTGTATVTKQGNSYKITGKLYDKRSPENTAPFEFDATCP